MVQELRKRPVGRPLSFPGGTEMYRVTVPKGLAKRVRKVAAEWDMTHGALLDHLLTGAEKRIAAERAAQPSPLHRPRSRPAPSISGYT